MPIQSTHNRHTYPNLILDKKPAPRYDQLMTNALTAPAPEWLEIANLYLTLQSQERVAAELALPLHTVAETLARKDVRSYLNEIYLDTGYRNRHKLGDLLDQIIQSKLEEAAESGMYSGKDLLDIIALVHKMRMDEAKLQQSTTEIKQQTNVQINDAGGGNYGKLMERLINGS